LGLVTNSFILFAFGVVGGIIPCLLWGGIGGDEAFTYKKTKVFLKLTHHWHIGVMLMLIGSFTHVFILGWGVGTAIDDLLFHSFENYFIKK